MAGTAHRIIWQTVQFLVRTIKVGNFQTAAPMKGRLRPRLRATRSDVGKKGIRKYTLGVLVAVVALSIQGFSTNL